MKLTITIDCDTAAFEDDADEAARIVRSIADTMLGGVYCCRDLVGGSWPVHDVNGNTVGTVAVSDETPDAVEASPLTPEQQQIVRDRARDVICEDGQDRGFLHDLVSSYVDKLTIEECAEAVAGDESGQRIEFPDFDPTTGDPWPDEDDDPPTRPDLSHDADCAYRLGGECTCEKDAR